MGVMGIITTFLTITKKCWVSPLNQRIQNSESHYAPFPALETFDGFPLLWAWSFKALRWPLSSCDGHCTYFLTNLTLFCLAVCTATTLALSFYLKYDKLLPIWYLEVYPPSFLHSLGLSLNATFSGHPFLILFLPTLPMHRLG